MISNQIRVTIKQNRTSQVRSSQNQVQKIIDKYYVKCVCERQKFCPASFSQIEEKQEETRKKTKTKKKNIIIYRKCIYPLNKERICRTSFANGVLLRCQLPQRFAVLYVLTLLLPLSLQLEKKVPLRSISRDGSPL